MGPKIDGIFKKVSGKVSPTKEEAKLEKAQELGVTILDESQLKELLK